MRYLFGFVCICALSTVPLVGCESKSCIDVGCPDDGNECTHEYCECLGVWCTPECVSYPADNGTDCTFDGAAGVCVSGVCGENICEGVVCEDGNACTDDACDYVDATCDFTPTSCFDGNDCTEDRCDPPDGCNFPPVEDGTICSAAFEALGMCEAGACVGPCDPESEEVLQCLIEDFPADLFCCPGWEYCTVGGCRPP
jgi:hypothetical protein